MDEDIDKTGYTKIKKEAVSKAVKYCPAINEITIGPNASSPSNNELTNLVYSPYSKTLLQRKVQKLQNEINKSDDVLITEKDREEERYCAKKLLAELNNFCQIDGQRKKLTLIKKRLEKLERAKQEVELMVANHDANARIRNQERQDQVAYIETQLCLRQQQLATSESITRDTANKRLQEIKKQEEEQLRLKEKAKESSKLFEQLYINQKEFTDTYSEIVNILKNYKKIKPLIADDIDKASEINRKFISIIEHCKVGEITPQDVNLSSSLLTNINTITLKIKTEIEKSEAELQEKILEEVEEIQEKKEQLVVGEKLIENEENKTDDKKVSKYNIMEKYNTVTNFLIKVESKLKPFLADESFKKYRSDCQKIVNLTVNAISPCSADHVLDKLKKLSTLLQGQYVCVADTRVSTGSHPLGLIYCTNLLAEKIVKQGEQVVSSKPDAAFAIAAVTVALWMEFPDFGKLLLAHFYRRCPYLIPAYWEMEEEQTEEEYYKKLGFIYSGGNREDLNMFLKRQGGIVKLFSSIMITDKKKSLQSYGHPLGLGEGWKLIVAFVKLEPRKEISATVLLDILEIVGDDMIKAYGIQFQKLLHIICKTYLPKIVEVSAEGTTGGPLSRLRNFLESIAKGKVLQPPKGLLPRNFW